jgi:hypothetical protein
MLVHKHSTTPTGFATTLSTPPPFNNLYINSNGECLPQNLTERVINALANKNDDDSATADLFEKTFKMNFEAGLNTLIRHIIEKGETVIINRHIIEKLEGKGITLSQKDDGSISMTGESFVPGRTSGDVYDCIDSTLREMGVHKPVVNFIAEHTPRRKIGMYANNMWRKMTLNYSNCTLAQDIFI